MEIEEIKNNQGVDAILEIGMPPGGFGFYGIADVLSGEESPSGHLSDTYAVVKCNSPPHRIMGIISTPTQISEKYINSTLVEAEGIYHGYKYYEYQIRRYGAGAREMASDPAGSSVSGNWS